MDHGKERLFDKIKLWAEQGTPTEVLTLWKKLGGKIVEKPEQATVLISDNEQAPLTREILTKRYNKFPNGVHRPVWSSEIVQYWAEEGGIVTNPAVTKVYLRRAPVELSFEFFDLESEQRWGRPGTLVAQQTVRNSETRGSLSPSIQTPSKEHSQEPNSPERKEKSDPGRATSIRKKKVGVRVAPMAEQRLRESLWMLPETDGAGRVFNNSKKPSKKAFQEAKALMLKHIHRRGIVCRVCNPNGVKVRKPRSPDAHYHRRGIICPACASLKMPKDKSPGHHAIGDARQKRKNKVDNQAQRRSNESDAQAPKRSAQSLKGEAPKSLDNYKDEKNRSNSIRENHVVPGKLSCESVAIEDLQRLRDQYAQSIEYGMGLTKIQIGREGFELRPQSEVGA
jgi:hypothetical protein